MFASLPAAIAWFASVEAAAAGGNVISPDGRTLTHLDTNAGITNITTGTVRNGTGFNSFSQFQVGTGNTVNLHVPDAANKLLNIVRDGPVFVDGILNGYKNGQIGGDIYFADPHGFVVGPNGTVNVGSLTVQTPKAAFLDSVIDAQGNIDDAATAAPIPMTHCSPPSRPRSLMPAIMIQCLARIAISGSSRRRFTPCGSWAAARICS